MPDLPVEQRDRRFRGTAAPFCDAVRQPKLCEWSPTRLLRHRRTGESIRGKASADPGTATRTPSALAEPESGAPCGARKEPGSLGASLLSAGSAAPKNR